ncbi:acyl-CoA thioesterase [Saccharospirillum impatiens]|uniref:acyl-CoA thioesterase n=1 Tax=Saccharospirillum impatiens TaxID=169438 RepID=UPI0004019F97|nr:thioesterase family protein [Saccharospirillum impatiens]
MTYQTRHKVRFGHCDPAGIVYFPRYFEMINAVVEDWFADAVGRDFNSLHIDSGTSVPTVNLKTDFKVPSRLGDWLDFRLTVTRIGNASLTLCITAHCGNTLRLSNESTLVYVDMASGKPRRWPDTLRQRFERDRETPAVTTEKGSS